MRVKFVEESIGFGSNLCMRFGIVSESDRVEGKVMLGGVSSLLARFQVI